MKQTTRFNTFETNSSSMHTLTILRDTHNPEINFKELALTIELTEESTNGFSSSGSVTHQETVKQKLTYIWSAIEGRFNSKYQLEWATEAEHLLKEWLPKCTFVHPKEFLNDFYINPQSNDLEFIKDMFKDKKFFYKALKDGIIYLWSDGYYNDDENYIYYKRG